MRPYVAIVDYGSGNLRSAEKALARAASDRRLDLEIRVTANAAEIRAAERLVLPGVGAFRAAMAALASLPGVLTALEHAVLVEKRPFLGVCVGMQMLAEHGLEFGRTAGLGWIPGVVQKLDGAARHLPVPQIGWNEVALSTGYPPLPALSGPPRDYYFVHSFHFETENGAHLLAVCDYGGPVAAVVGRDNILGVQFHPEKSQSAGLNLLGDFLQWRP